MENNIKLMVIYGDLVMNKEDYSKYYIQGSDHYLIPKDVFIELFEEMENWREEAKELKEKYLNAVADYETTMFEKEQLNSLVNSCQEEIRRLKKQLEYLRSGEYYNQLRFENEMLQQVVDTNGVPSEVYDYIDCTHRNTELLEENQELKKQLEENKDKINWYENFEINKTIDKLRIKHNNQQKEFIEYMNKTIEELECDDVDDEEMKGYLIQRIDTFKEILQKYKNIIGVLDDKK